MQSYGNRLEPDLYWELQMESVVGTGVRGNSGGVVIVGAELCPLKKRCPGGRGQKKKDIEVLTTTTPHCLQYLRVGLYLETRSSQSIQVKMT